MLDMISGGAGTLAASTAVAALKQVHRADPKPARGHASFSVRDELRRVAREGRFTCVSLFH
jgi:hypothetical protein